MSTLATVFALAAEAVEDEPNKTPFYIIGAALAAYAVGLSVLGLTNPNFATQKNVRSAVCAISALIVAATMATAVITS